MPLYTFKVPARIGEKLSLPKGFSYTQKGAPCKKERIAKGGCAVELVFQKGQPKLRFCKAQGKAGILIPASNPKEAARIASQVCRCYEKSGSFDRCIPKRLNPTLGKTKRKRRRR